jgi:hypothetical protein
VPLCECGCGQEVRRKFARGHNIIKNPSKHWLGKHHSEETKRQISKSMEGKNKGKVTWNNGKHLSEKTKEKMSKKKKGKNTGVQNNFYGKHHTESTKNIIASKNRESMKQRWQDPEYREKTINATLKAMFKRPTSLEKQMLAIIEKHSLPYRYTGNGSFIIEGRCPDFVNVNGEKTCIEVRSKRMCKYWNNCTPEEYERQRKEHFAKYGWECIVIFDEDLQNEEAVISRIIRGGL